VAIYLTAHAWTQFDIGLVLTAGGLVALAGQMPGGVLVDAVRSARLLGGLAVAAICLSALAMAIWPIFPVVLASRVLHASASCVIGPIVAAISLGLVGHAALGARLGRNARFASIGNGVAAAGMGLCGLLVSNQAVFFLTALLVAPALVALVRIRPHDITALEPDVIEHMNGDHREAMNLYATKLLGADGADWRCTGCDPGGMDLRAGARTLRLDFPERVTSGAELRKMLVRLAAEARARA